MVAEYSVEFVASAAKEFRSLPADLKHKIGLTVASFQQSSGRFHGLFRPHMDDDLGQLLVMTYSLTDSRYWPF